MKIKVPIISVDLSFEYFIVLSSEYRRWNLSSSSTLALIYKFSSIIIDFIWNIIWETNAARPERGQLSLPLKILYMAILFRKTASKLFNQF